MQIAWLSAAWTWWCRLDKPSVDTSFWLCAHCKSVVCTRYCVSADCQSVVQVLPLSWHAIQMDWTAAHFTWVSKHLFSVHSTAAQHASYSSRAKDTVHIFMPSGCCTAAKCFYTQETVTEITLLVFGPGTNSKSVPSCPSISRIPISPMYHPVPKTPVMPLSLPCASAWVYVTSFKLQVQSLIQRPSIDDKTWRWALR